MPQIPANGLTFEYETFGDKTGPAILLIMGFSAQMTMWPLALCEGLAARGFHVIRFDNRDAGLSSHLSHLGMPDVPGAFAKAAAGEPVNPPYHLDDMAMDAAAVLEALGISNAHIVGASMGGFITQIIAAKHKAVTRSMVSIMSSTGRRDLPPAKPEAMAVLMTPPASDSREDRIAAAIRGWQVIGSPGFRDSDAELREAAEQAVDRAPYDPAAAARQLVAILAAPPRNEMLKTVTAPARIIHGADDPLVPLEGGRDTAASIHGADLVIVPGMGHGFENQLVPVYLEHIGDFVEAVERRARG